MNKQYIKSEKSLVIDENERLVLNVVGSTGIIDRVGDSVNPQGWEIENYLKNPIVLFGHNYQSYPVGKAVKVWVEDDKLKFNIKFAPTEEGIKTFELIKGGYLNATSVGFIPKEFGVPGKDKYTILKQELLELSIVPVPANPEALTSDLKDKYALMLKSLNDKINEKKDKEIKEPDKVESKEADKAVENKSDVNQKDDNQKKDEKIDNNQKDNPKDIKDVDLTLKENRIKIENVIEKLKEAVNALTNLLKNNKVNDDKTDDTKILLQSIRDLMKSQDKKLGLGLRELKKYFNQ